MTIEKVGARKEIENISKQIIEIKKIYDGDISDFAQSYLLQNKSIKFINFGLKHQTGKEVIKYN